MVLDSTDHQGRPQRRRQSQLQVTKAGINRNPNGFMTYQMTQSMMHDNYKMVFSAWGLGSFFAAMWPVFPSPTVSRAGSQKGCRSVFAEPTEPGRRESRSKNNFREGG